MNNEISFDDNFNWATEYYVLYESQRELIMLHRNMLRNEETVIMTANLFLAKDQPTKFWCSMVEHHQLLRHRKKIKRYQREQDNFKLFKSFFRMNIDEFFGLISEPV